MTGIDYARLIDTAHHNELARGVNYAALTAPSSAAPSSEHLLDHSQLESVRMLTNHDMDSTSPFACLLVGQPTLRRNMKLGRPRRARPAHRAALRHAPMTGEETGSYCATT